MRLTDTFCRVSTCRLALTLFAMPFTIPSVSDWVSLLPVEPEGADAWVTVTFCTEAASVKIGYKARRVLEYGKVWHSLVDTSVTSKEELLPLCHQCLMAVKVIHCRDDT